MPRCGIAEVGNHIGRGEHIDRRADPVQPAKDMQRVMLESRERLRREEEVYRDAIRHGITASHCRMLAKGFPLREARLHSDLIARESAARPAGWLFRTAVHG